MNRRLVLLVALVACWLGVGVADAAPTPIPDIDVPPQPAFIGHAASARPVRGVPRPPRNPFMARNPFSEIHNDGWQTDAYAIPGPLGRSPVTLSAYLMRDCGSLTFDRAGRVVSICVGSSGPQLYMFDPKTLDTLATYSLPPRQSVPSNIFQDFTGGGYFYLDNQDRVVTSTTTRHVLVIAETPGTPGFSLVRDYDLSGVLSAGEGITSALPDSHGLLWFVTKADGVVGTLNLRTGLIRHVQLGSGTAVEIENSFAVGNAGDVYIATNRKLFRFVAGRDGTPRVVWSVVYPNSGIHKPGQVDDGTGTTPTVMAGGYVNITDNADPMDIVVYRDVPRLRRGVKRLVCRVPVFSRGSSADENSIIVAGRSMIAENNYGYVDPTSVTGGKLTAPGFVRVDLRPGGRGCRVVWRNNTEVAPTVVTKLSVATGLIYSYTKSVGSSDPWYWTALDFRTGRVVWKVYSGSGSLGFNNNYAGLALGPDHTAYLGSIGGIMALRDG